MNNKHADQETSFYYCEQHQTVRRQLMEFKVMLIKRSQLT